MVSVTFRTSDEKLEKIDTFIKKNKHIKDRSDIINKSLDFFIQHIETKFLSDFIYYIGLPSLAFIGSIFLTFYLTDIIFYIIAAIIGVYLVILVYLFRYKYRGGRKSLKM